MNCFPPPVLHDQLDGFFLTGSVTPPCAEVSFISSATSSSALPQHLWVQARCRKHKCIGVNVFFFLLCCHITAEPVEGKPSRAPRQGKSLSAGLSTSTTGSATAVPTRCSNKLQPSHSASGKLINGNPHLIAKDHLEKKLYSSALSSCLFPLSTLTSPFLGPNRNH